MQHRLTRGVVGLFVLALIWPAQAADIGDPAGELQVSTWLKNGPVTLSAGKGKNIFVIEFWATWCRPCLDSIPHLTGLQKRYRDKGVVIVGLTDEPASVAQPFVDKMGDKMEYAVGVDRREATSDAYMGAFGIETIPYAFVVDKNGLVAWHGHPETGLDLVLERMIAGKYDIELAKREAAALKLIDEYFQHVEAWNAARDVDARTKVEAQARRTGEAILEKAARSPGVLSEFASAIVLVPGTAYRDLDLAAKAADASYRASEKTQADKVRKLMHDYFRTLRSGGRAGERGVVSPAQKQRTLAESGRQIVEQAGPEELKEFAWTIMAAPELEPRDLRLALKAADAARAKTRDQDATILDTYARALFENGQRDKAVEFARKALEVNKDERMERLFRDALEHYQEAAAGPAGP